MALPVSQGGIDYQDGGFSSGIGGYPMIGDLAELAARLWSPNSFDRRGTIIWMTDFENGLQGSSFTVAGSGSEGIISAARAHRGGYSVKLDPAAEENSYVLWNRVIQYLPTGQVGLEATLSPNTDPYAAGISMIYRDGATRWTGSLYYYPDTGCWRIQTEDAGWVTVLNDFKLQQGPNAWHPIKLVIDPSTGKYVRFLAARYEEDISSYDLETAADTALGQLEVRTIAWGSVDDHAPVWFDSILVTQNEP